MWNYRVVRTTDDDGEWFEIREIYYREKNKGEGYDNIRAWTECSVDVSGESVEIMASTLVLMQAALAKPILELLVLVSNIT